MKKGPFTILYKPGFISGYMAENRKNLVFFVKVSVVERKVNFFNLMGANTWSLAEGKTNGLM
jgi:hypothetical protein